MEYLSPQAWFAVAGILFAGVTGALYILSCMVRDATKRIELHREVNKLRAAYADQVRHLEARGFKVRGEVDLVDETTGKKAA